MNSDNISKAVELADGWGWAVYDEPESPLLLEYADGGMVDGDFCCTPDDIPQLLKDALAAQLVRQVDALAFPYDAVFVTVGNTSVEWPIGTNYFVEGPNRTDNTINAILESGVLAKK